MKELDVVDLYERTSDNYIEKFLENTKSEIHTKVDYEKVREDTEWMDIIEETIPYIYEIFKNPNKFITNEEEVKKIELTKKVTIESIKHLAKNTNLIQDIDDEGDVIPSSLLNVYKEESYDTYENRMIYTLIQNMRFYIEKRRGYIESRLKEAEKNNRQIDYNGESKISGEVVNLELHISTRLDTSQKKKSENEYLLDRIGRITQKIDDITHTELYNILDKLKFAAVTSPIKKTNLILKNVRFQYATKLWEYMQTHIEDSSTKESIKEDRDDNEEIKALTDETFFLEYLVTRILVEDDFRKREKLQNRLTTTLIQRIISINPDMPVEDFKKMIGDKYEVVRNNNQASANEIQVIFKKNIELYLENLK